MRRLRANRTFGLLAFAALTFQIIVSFGHVHLDGLKRASPVSAVVGSPVQTAQISPAQPPAEEDGDGYCAICATIFLAANSFVPQAPQLPAWFVSQVIEHFDCVAAIFIAPGRAPFQSRAPPPA